MEIPVPPAHAGTLAERVRAAIESADIDGYRDLLAPNARWGEGAHPGSGCQNRDQILEWYTAGRAAGRRATVTELEVGDGTLLVGVNVSGLAEDTHDPVERWQVLTVRFGQVVDIRGYDDRATASAAAGLTS